MLAPDAVSLLLLAGATWRLSALLSYERGPWDIALRLRAAVGITADPVDGVTPDAWPMTFLAQVLVCVWCLSFWIGIGWATLWIFAPRVAVLAAMPFALSAAAILIERWSGR